jgi:hypothetical protein
VKVPILDEAWVAWVDQATMIQPTVARGLAWIDPKLVPGLAATRSPGPDLREALAWRWIAEDALARVDREPVEQEPAASVRIHARIDSARQRLLIDGRLMVYAGAGALDSVPLWVGLADGSLESWRFTDMAGTPLVTRPIDAPDRARLGFPPEGLARSLVVTVPYQTEKTIEFHAEYPWNHHGVIPLVSPARAYLSRGMVVVETPGKMQSRVQAAGLRRLAAPAVEQAEHQPGDLNGAVSRDGREPVKFGAVDASIPGAHSSLVCACLRVSRKRGRSTS